MTVSEERKGRGSYARGVANMQHCPPPESSTTPDQNAMMVDEWVKGLGRRYDVQPTWDQYASLATPPLPWLLVALLLCLTNWRVGQLRPPTPPRPLPYITSPLFITGCQPPPPPSFSHSAQKQSRHPQWCRLWTCVCRLNSTRIRSRRAKVCVPWQGYKVGAGEGNTRPLEWRGRWGWRWTRGRAGVH